MWETSPVWALLHSKSYRRKRQVNPNEFGKKLGIGVRVAGRIAQQRMAEQARETDPASRAASSIPRTSAPGASQSGFGMPTREQVQARSREVAAKSHKYTRAAGRGV